MELNSAKRHPVPPPQRARLRYGSSAALSPPPTHERVCSRACTVVKPVFAALAVAAMLVAVRSKRWKWRRLMMMGLAALAAWLVLSLCHTLFDDVVASTQLHHVPGFHAPSPHPPNRTTSKATTELPLRLAAATNMTMLLANSDVLVGFAQVTRRSHEERRRGGGWLRLHGVGDLQLSRGGFRLRSVNSAMQVPLVRITARLHVVSRPTLSSAGSSRPGVRSGLEACAGRWNFGVVLHDLESVVGGDELGQIYIRLHLGMPIVQTVESPLRITRDFDFPRSSTFRAESARLAHRGANGEEGAEDSVSVTLSLEADRRVSVCGGRGGGGGSVCAPVVG
jgi:hypothetical protein